MAITLRTIVQRRLDALGADVGGEVVLMSVERGKYYGLDEIGSNIWRRIEQPVDVASLCAALQAEYDADAAALEHDVIALLERLADQGLVVEPPNG